MNDIGIQYNELRQIEMSLVNEKWYKFANFIIYVLIINQHFIIVKHDVIFSIHQILCRLCNFQIQFHCGSKYPIFKQTTSIINVINIGVSIN